MKMIKYISVGFKCRSSSHLTILISLRFPEIFVMYIKKSEVVKKQVDT